MNAELPPGFEPNRNLHPKHQGGSSSARDDRDSERVGGLAAPDDGAVLDTALERDFDDIVSLAACACRTPVALISLVAGNRRWFTARPGLDLGETPLSEAICAHAILQPGTLVMPDLAADSRTAGTALVTGPPHLRFYAGARLEGPRGDVLGTLGVADTSARPQGLTEEQDGALQVLARQVVAQMELRRLIAAQNRAMAEGRRTERRQRFLLALEDRLRGQRGPRGRMQAAVDALGEHLRVDRAGYGLVGESGTAIAFETEYVNRVARLGGIHGLAMLGAGLVVRLQAGKTSAVRDVATDGATAGGGLGRLGIGALLAVPQVDGGRLRSVIYVGHTTPRDWATEEIGLIEEVAARVWDAVERVRAEEALRRALQDAREFARLAGTALSGVGFWTYDVRADRFTYDARTADLYGLPARQGGIGLPRDAFLANVDAADLPRLQAVMAGGLASPGDLEMEYRIVHPDGSRRWVLSRGHTQFDAEGPLRRIGIGIDTTRQHELEAQLDHAQKMEAVGQLTGGLAHDFNNLLTGLTGSLELLQARLAQGRVDELDRYVGTAQRATQRAAALTQRLLAFSRRQALDPQPTDVNRLVAGLHELVERTIGPSITLRLTSAQDLWTTLIDPGQLENALLNLCINARDAMVHGSGTIDIETRNVTGADVASDAPPGEHVCLSVRDDGVGMTAEIATQAFDPFFTTKPVGAGTGLGLSMVYGFVRRSGGDVRIHSVPGKGTEVRLYLPRHRDMPDSEPMPELHPPKTVAVPGIGAKSVLLVDDDPTVRMVIGETLERSGCTVLEAASGPAALSILAAGTHVDLLITDLGLPGGVNGWQLADAARLVRPGLRVLFITGYADDAVPGMGRLAAGMDVLAKPFAMDTLVGRIGHSLAAMAADG